MNSFQQVEYVVVKWFSTFNVRKSSKRLPGKHDVFQFPWYLGPISAVLENLQVVFCKSTFLWSLCMWNVGPCVEIAKFLLTCSMWLCGSENLRLQPLIISATSAISTIFDSELCDSAPDALRLKSLLNWDRASNLFEKCFQTVSVLKIKCQSGAACTLHQEMKFASCFLFEIFNHWNSKRLFFCKCKNFQTSVEVKGVLCSGRRRCTAVPHGGWFRGAEPTAQQQQRSPRSFACRKASGTSRTRLGLLGDSNLEFGSIFIGFCVKLEVSTFCFQLLGLLPDLHCCLGQDIEVATGFWQDTLYQLVRWCMALPYWPLLLQDFWLVQSGHQR